MMKRAALASDRDRPVPPSTGRREIVPGRDGSGSVRRPSSASRAQQSPAAEEALDISVAVCSRNRPRVLERALTSLLAQSRPPSEILVVDNAPADDSTRVLVRDRFPGVAYVREAVPGLDFARNRALERATGDVVAFLDDDAVAHRDWVSALAGAFRAGPRVAVCLGRVEALSLAHEAQRMFEANGGFSRGRLRIRLPADAGRRLHGHPAPLIAWAVSVGSGCSYAVRRRVALDLGGFDEALDLGMPLPGGGDHDLLWRALESGFEVLYEPGAVAWHEHRADLAAVQSQIVGHQRAVIAFLVKQALRTRGRARAPILAFLAWRLSKPGVRLLRRALGRDPLPAGLLLRMWWGCWLALGDYRRARKLAQARREAAAT